MMKRVLVLLFVVGVLSVFVQPATASLLLRDPQLGDTVTFWDGGDSSGGPFTAQITYSGGTTTTKWSTFCVEKNEWIHVNDGTKYKMDPDGPWTERQTVAKQNWVTDEAKWLFHEYNSGALSAYNGSRVQDAIWYYTHAGSEGGLSLWDGVSGRTSPQVAADWVLINLAHNTMPNGWDSSDVRILNPYLEGNYGGNHAQSCLYEVPEPATIIVWSLLGAASWLGMRVVRRGRPVGRQQWSPESRAAIYEIISR
jgi:hypothetical protein